MSLEDFWARCRAHHAAEVEEGLHDHACEWRDAGHFICNCSMRKRVALGFIEPPTLHFHNPTCGKCYEEVSHDDDSFVCENCHVSWSSSDEDTPGTFTDDFGVLDMAKWDAERSQKQLSHDHQ